MEEKNKKTDDTLLPQENKQNTIEGNMPKPVKEKPKSWQQRMLPLMAGMLIALTLFFFIATFIQMSYLHLSILNSPPIADEPASGEALLAGATDFVDLYQARQFEVRAAMERFIVEKRYHQASVYLMSGLWLRYLGFVTGMILALVGASFILGKLREPSQKLEGKFSEISLSLSTASPGIILAVLGVVLMFATLVDRDTYNVTDDNIYLSVKDTLVTPELATEPLPPLQEIFGSEIESQVPLPEINDETVSSSDEAASTLDITATPEGGEP